MSARDFISYVGVIFRKIFDILSVRPFTDFPISYIDIFLVAIILKVVFSFITGGYKEMDDNNFIGGLNFVHNRVSKKMSNKEREKQIVNQKKIRQYRAMNKKVSSKGNVVFNKKTGEVIE